MLKAFIQSRLCLGAGLAVASVVSISLSGCAIGSEPTPTSALSLTSQTGKAMGGQQPVANATVTLWKAGTTSTYGQGATSLYTTSSDAGGNFLLTSNYTCASGDMIYITAYGGNPGGGTNSAMGLMAALGECTALQATPFIVVNEATTIAGMTALQQFTKVTYGTSGLNTLAASGTPLNIGAPASNKVGLVNAFATVNNLASATAAPTIPQTYAKTATVNGTATTVTVTPPYAKIATLANILSSCVNSNDGTGISAGCTTLFSAEKPSTQTLAPADTVQAALDLAINPSNVGGTTAAPYSLAPASPPFQPALTAPPNDWTLNLTFVSSTVVNSATTPAIFLYESTGLQIDSAGNIYVLNYANAGNSNKTTSPYNNSVAEFSPTGTPVGQYMVGMIGYPTTLVLDPSNGIWVGESFSGDVVKYISSTSVAHVTFSGSNPSYLASDSAGNIFASTVDGKLWKASPTSAAIYTTGTQLGTLPTVRADYLSLDSNLNIWVGGAATTSSSGNQYIDVFPCTPGVGVACTGTTTNTYGTATAFTAFPLVNSVLGNPAGIAFDNNNNAFVAATTYYSPSAGSYTYGYGCEFVLTLATATANTTPACSTNGLAALDEPGQALTDGAGNVWVADRTANTSFGNPVSGIKYNAGTFTSVSGSKGYPSASVVTSLLQLDQSGNVWTAANGLSGVGTITEVVGVVAPVYAPLSLALANGSLGKSPQ